MPVFFLALRRLRGPLITLICVYAVAVLGLTLIPGVDSNGNPWRMDFFHAFYFVSFMGSTIGFGEIPYPFTDAQRLWVLVCIYFSVVAWLYAIGRAITLAQEPAFRQAVTYGTFEHAVKRIGESFYIICGYGDTGRLLVRGFSRHNTRTVVIDRDQEQINNLELTDHGFYVPGLRADVNHPDHLITAGLKRSRCAGVIAVTNSDHINLKVAISSKLLQPHLPVICRSEIHDVGINMASFGTDEIVNPFDIFADRLAMALHSPANFVIHQWLTSPANTLLSEPLFPPKGRWILCGYGRFGKAIQKILSLEGIEATVIEVNPQQTQAPENTIWGRGTEAVTLVEGGVEQAVGIIAGTDDDANNLSIIMTARELNEKLFIVARQNRQENDALFEAANLDLVMQRSDIIARTIITRITNPLLADFLNQLPRDDEEWSNVLATRISGVCENTAHTWNVVATKSRAPALAVALFNGEFVTLGMILEDYEHAETSTSCLPLLLKRDHKTIMLPPLDTKLEHGDQILFTGP
ncbi:MAG: NAD-binding protein, partial [Arenicellales bacterium]|nr:NAD-binding protein [Arenicellales bacterium]